MLLISKSKTFMLAEKMFSGQIVNKDMMMSFFLAHSHSSN